MRKFFIKVLFLLIPILLLLIVGAFLPPSKSVKRSLLFAQIDKDSLLINTPGPRIVFVGGSNLSFGLNCQMIKDSLHINPINTAIHAGIGLKYMLRNTLKNIHENDIVIVSPEYHQFYGQADGATELLHMVFEVSPNTKKLLDPGQCYSLLKYYSAFSLSKLNPFTYFKHQTAMIDLIYSRNSFNAYGDAYKHWSLPKENYEPKIVKGDIDNDVFTLLKDFRKDLEAKNAKLFVTFPCFQDVAFKQSVVQIKTIERKLNEDGFVLLGTPERYEMPDSLTFNTSYHLIGKGVELRTKLLIEDIKKAGIHP